MIVRGIVIVDIQIGGFHQSRYTHRKLTATQSTQTQSHQKNQKRNRYQEIRPIDFILVFPYIILTLLLLVQNFLFAFQVDLFEE